jgi:hypothetical protein
VTPSQPPIQAPQTEAPRPSGADKAYIGTLVAIASILAVRLLLLLAVCGTFVLAALSIGNPSVLSIILVGVFGTLTVGPLALLDFWRGGR